MAPSRALVSGWREWVHLPDLGIRLIKAKVDTGARTSALHADEVERFRRRGVSMVRFTVYPKQRSHHGGVCCTAEVIDERLIRSSNGHTDHRPVIRTDINLGGDIWPIELTLTRRDAMGFRMLLGRQAVRGHLLVDPGRSFVTRRVKKRR